MMKQQKSGEMKGKTDITGDLSNLKPGDGIQVGDTKYEYGADLNAEGVRIEDPGIGKTVSIRVFEFTMSPDKVKNFPDDKQFVFNLHAKQISTILWGDGLRPLEEISPRVIIDRKGGKYKIFITCEARLNTLFAEKPRSLSEQLKPNKNATTRH